MGFSPWEDWRENRNPYRRTPFQVLGFSPALTGRGSIKAAIRQRRQRIRSTPERFPLFGEMLDVADVNEAEERLDDPEGWAYARLCSHQPRTASIDVSVVALRLAEVDPPLPTPKPTIDASRLALLVPPPRRRVFPPLIEG